MSSYYYYGLAAMLYLTSCWVFSIVRWCHTCRAYTRPAIQVDMIQCTDFVCTSDPYAYDEISDRSGYARDAADRVFDEE